MNAACVKTTGRGCNDAIVDGDKTSPHSGEIRLPAMRTRAVSKGGGALFWDQKFAPDPTAPDRMNSRAPDLLDLL